MNTIPVQMHAIVTDAGQFIDKMVIDYKDSMPSKIDLDTFQVKMTSTITFGELNEKPYPYYDASRPIEIVKTEVNDTKLTIYFNQGQAPTITWLKEGRNNPARLSFSIQQTKPLHLIKDNTEMEFIGEYTCLATSYKDLVDEEVQKFTSVLVEDGINYQFYKGSNKRLIVWFHGNGEGDFPIKATNNNIIQLLGNRGGVAWISSEAQEVFGDASVMAFQAPNMWYFAKPARLLEKAYNEIQQVIKENQIDSSELYLAGCSAGGYMSTRMLIAYPSLFKAAMITCPALDVANLRSNTKDSIPTDEELQTLTSSQTKIWLVQGETDGVVDTEKCAKRIWKFLSQGKSILETKVTGSLHIASDFTTYETEDDKYKLTLYKTVDLHDGKGTMGDVRKMGNLVFVEDYNQDGIYEEVRYNDHWSWIYTLRNNPEDKEGIHIWNWAIKE